MICSDVVPRTMESSQKRIRWPSIGDDGRVAFAADVSGGTTTEGIFTHTTAGGVTSHALSGAVAPGTEAVRRAIREGEAQLILMAGDASSVQLDKIRTTLHDRAIPQAVLGDRDALGSALGLAPLSAVAVTNSSFAARLLEELAAEVGGVEQPEV